MVQNLRGSFGDTDVGGPYLIQLWFCLVLGDLLVIVTARDVEMASGEALLAQVILVDFLVYLRIKDSQSYSLVALA